MKLGFLFSGIPFAELRELSPIHRERCAFCSEPVRSLIQAKERSLTLLTADGGIQRIADADPEVMFLLV